MRKRKQEVHFARNVKFLRKKHQITQVDLADHLEVSAQTIVKWEMGIGKPKGKTLVRLARVFEVEIEQLIHENLEIELSDLSERAKEARRAYENPYYTYNEQAWQAKAHYYSNIAILVTIGLQAIMLFFPLDTVGNIILVTCMVISVIHIYFIIRTMLLGNRYTLEEYKYVHKRTSDFRLYCFFVYAALIVWTWYTTVSHLEDEIMLRNMTIHSVFGLLVLAATVSAFIFMRSLIRMAELRLPLEDWNKKKNEVE